MKITIIGAGIGGLTTAIALKQKGFDIEIFESSTGFKKAGSGINLAINAMQVYKRLGLYKKIEKAGSFTNVMNVTDKDLNIISSVQLEKATQQFNTKTFAIHRAILHQILLDKLQGVSIVFNKKLSTLTQKNNKVQLIFEDRTKHIASIVIGADGIHSATRKALFCNTSLRIAKQVCWRGITTIKLPNSFNYTLHEAWGKGSRFGFVHVAKDTVYWFALCNYKNNYKAEYSDSNIISYFSDYHPTIKNIISSTPKDTLIVGEIADLKPIDKWYSNKVCLVGDAAHATTPNMGQGACQAIESAYVLAQCLSTENDVTQAFEKYQNIRKKIAINVVKTSWSIGKIAQLNNTFLIFLRNTVIKMMSKKMMEKKSFTLFKLNY